MTSDKAIHPEAVRYIKLGDHGRWEEECRDKDIIGLGFETAHERFSLCRAGDWDWATFASRANSCQASALTVAHLLGHASTQILPTYVKAIDENTRAVIEAMNDARVSHSAQLRSIQ